MTSATTAMMPIFSSENFSERVRGIDLILKGPAEAGHYVPSRKKRLNVAVGRAAKLVGRPFENDQAIFQHHEFRLLHLFRAGLLKLYLVAASDGFLRGDEEG